MVESLKDICLRQMTRSMEISEVMRWGWCAEYPTKHLTHYPFSIVGKTELRLYDVRFDFKHRCSQWHVILDEKVKSMENVGVPKISLGEKTASILQIPVTLIADWRESIKQDPAIAPDSEDKSSYNDCLGNIHKSNHWSTRNHAREAECYKGGSECPNPWSSDKLSCYNVNANSHDWGWHQWERLYNSCEEDARIIPHGEGVYDKARPKYQTPWGSDESEDGNP